jgi:signal peptidase I
MIGSALTYSDPPRPKPELNWWRGLGALVLGFLLIGGGVLLDRRWRLAIFYQLSIPALCLLARALMPGHFLLGIAIIFGIELLALLALFQGAWFGLRKPAGVRFPRMSRSATTAAVFGIVFNLAFQLVGTYSTDAHGGWSFFGYKSYVQAGRSMEPTLQTGDRIVVDLRAYKKSAPKRGDIVAFSREGSIFTKRVEATPGDVVEYSDGGLVVNGKTLAEPYLDGRNPDDAVSWDTSKHAVGDGEVYVLGDSRFNSNDSRFFGNVPLSSVIGRVVGVYWPLNNARGIPHEH